MCKNVKGKKPVLLDSRFPDLKVKFLTTKGIKKRFVMCEYLLINSLTVSFRLRGCDSTSEDYSLNFSLWPTKVYI